MIFDLDLGILLGICITNFPGPESGVSFRYGHRDWKCYNAHLQDWVEGGVGVTCVMR